MAYCGFFSSLVRRRHRRLLPFSGIHLTTHAAALHQPVSEPPPSLPSESSPKPGSLSARLSFVFDQLDALDRNRRQEVSTRDEALRRLRSWRHEQQHLTPSAPPPPPPPPEGAISLAGKCTLRGDEDSAKEESRQVVELVHPWPEWIELMERLSQQRYFDTNPMEEERVARSAGIDLSEVREEMGVDVFRDWITVRTACMKFGRDRFDILKSLSRKDLQILVGSGCPSMDTKVVFSAKLLRKYTHVDEGNVCSSCSLRNSCSRGYILTHKEDEARTLDVIRVLLTYGFDHVRGTVENKPLMKIKALRNVVRKLLHEVAKLSAVPIDPNLPPPVVKKPPPKVKQLPPPPKRRVGRDDVEMKKGDWLCPKCDFMNFAKNNICLRCDAKRPKRELLPGEWECPRCNFLNYRRNMSCFHCEHKRPQDECADSHFQANEPHQSKMDGRTRLSGVSDAWNFNFDDDESDGADVAAFEFADSYRRNETNSVEGASHEGNTREFRGSHFDNRRSLRTPERGRSYSEADEIKESLESSRTGFDDFDDEEDDVDSYELERGDNSACEVSRKNFSELESSESDDITNFRRHSKTSADAKSYVSDSEGDDQLNVSGSSLDDHSRLRSSKDTGFNRIRSPTQTNTYNKKPFASDDDDAGLDSDSDGDLDAVFGPGRRMGQKNVRRNDFRTRRNFDSDDEPFDTSNSDDDDHRMRRVKTRGNKRTFDRGLDRHSIDRSSDSRREFTRADSSRIRDFRTDKGNKQTFDRREKHSFDRRSDNGRDFNRVDSSRTRGPRIDKGNKLTFDRRDRHSSDRRSDSTRNFNGADSLRTRDFRKDTGKRRDDDSFSGGSRSHHRSSHGEKYGGFRRNDRSKF